MLYCFVRETLNVMSNDELCIQANYAKAHGIFIELDLDSQLFFNDKKEAININDRLIFLRTDYEHILDAMICIERHGGILLENNIHRQAIKDWPNHYFTTRKMFCIEGINVIQQDYSEDIKFLLNNNEQVFFKSLDKGFSSLVNSIDLISGKLAIFDLTNKQGVVASQKYLVSEKVEIAKDHFGNTEVRIVVFNNLVANASRYIHSLCHHVDQIFIDTAKRIVSSLSAKTDFPDNYIMDLGLITSSEKSYVDVIEFNPISTSLCYVNNSVFLTPLSLTQNQMDVHGLGYEYFYDKIKYPGKYFLFDDGKTDFTYSRQ